MLAKRNVEPLQQYALQSSTIELGCLDAALVYRHDKDSYSLYLPDGSASETEDVPDKCLALAALILKQDTAFIQTLCSVVLNGRATPPEHE